ncbi:unnamed protein product [Mycena citricolor]|uniref:Uncharacterized protein n=1 Tax=Mycena citricolor TaxID=2018698 RepID=A0AAD2HPN1_9AGAR|nr:unnamed protein product [Mycena citricolor]
MESRFGFTGRRFMITGKHAHEGHIGLVVGYRHIDQPKKPTVGQESARERVVELTLNLDVGAKAYVELDQVVEIQTVQDSQPDTFYDDLLHRIRNPHREVIPPPDESVEGNYETPKGSSLSDKPTDVFEHDDMWLAHPDLMGKRIDVRVKSVAEIENARDKEKERMKGKNSRYLNAFKKKTFQHAGKTGLVVPSQSMPWNRRQFMQKFVLIQLGGYDNAYVPAECLEPVRTVPDDQCISTVRGRVIVIGFDCGKQDADIGRYAEVIPESSKPSKVLVCFQESVGGRKRTNIFPIGLLCRATNESLPHLELWATDFTTDN